MYSPFSDNLFENRYNGRTMHVFTQHPIIAAPYPANETPLIGRIDRVLAAWHPSRQHSFKEGAWHDDESPLAKISMGQTRQANSSPPMMGNCRNMPKSATLSNDAGSSCIPALWIPFLLEQYHKAPTQESALARNRTWICGFGDHHSIR